MLSRKHSATALFLALAASSLIAVPTPAMPDEATADGGGLGGLIGNLFGQFPFLNSLLEGANISLGNLQTVLPFLEIVTTGEFGLPDLQDVDELIAERESSVSDAFFGNGADITTGEITSFYRTEARVISGQAASASVLSASGQQTSVDALEKVAQMEGAISTSVTETDAIAAEGLAGDTSFGLLQALTNDRRQAAMRDREEASINGQIASGIEQQNVLSATAVELAAADLEATNAERIRSQRQRSGTSQMLKTARGLSPVFGGE